MRLADPEQLAHVGLTLYERKALMALMLCGVADAATSAVRGTSRPRRSTWPWRNWPVSSSSRSSRRVRRCSRRCRRRWSSARALRRWRGSDRTIRQRAPDLQTTFAGLQSRCAARHPFVDLALGVEGHNRRHLVPLAAARKRILSYMEAGDLMAIDAAVNGGYPILRRIAKNAAEHGVEHRVVFGFSYQSAGALVEFLKAHRHDLRQVTGVRYSGELGHPFHVVDDETVVLPLPIILSSRKADSRRCSSVIARVRGQSGGGFSKSCGGRR